MKDNSITDKDVEEAWQKIRSLGLTPMKDGSYTLATTSQSYGNTTGINSFVSNKLTRELMHRHLTDIYREATSCPISGRQVKVEPREAVKNLFEAGKVIK